MRFLLKVGDTEYTKCISSINCIVNTPNDSNARSNSIDNTMTIIGVIGTDESTVAFYNWAILSPGKNDVYKNVSFEILGDNNKILRKVEFPDAFVVDYWESYLPTDGTGTFNLLLKQKNDKNKDIKVDDK